MELERLTSDVGLSWTRDVDSFDLKVIGPENTVAATYRAITRRDRLERAIETPFNCAAVAGTVDHLSTRFDYSCARSASNCTRGGMRYRITIRSPAAGAD